MANFQYEGGSKVKIEDKAVPNKNKYRDKDANDVANYISETRTQAENAQSTADTANSKADSNATNKAEKSDTGLSVDLNTADKSTIVAGVNEVKTQANDLGNSKTDKGGYVGTAQDLDNSKADKGGDIELDNTKSVTGGKIFTVTNDINKKNDKNNIHLNALSLKNTTSLVYSDDSIGDLGTNFTYSCFSSAELSFYSFYLVAKGDPLVDGWGIRLDNTGYKLIVKGTEYFINGGRIDVVNFFTISSDSVSTKLYNFGVLVFEITENTTTAGALRIESANLFDNCFLYYLSISKDTLPVSDILTEVNLISKPYARNEMYRDFIGNSLNLDSTGFKQLDKSFSGTAVVVATDYPVINSGLDTLQEYTDLSNEHAYISSLGVKNLLGVSGNIVTRVTDFFEVTKKKSITIKNAIESVSHYNCFYDSNFKLIEGNKSGTGAVTVVASKTLDVPDSIGKIYAKVSFSVGGYVEGIDRTAFSEPKSIRSRREEIIRIDRTAPVIVDAYMESKPTYSPEVIKVMTVESSTSEYVVLTQSDSDLFISGAGYYPMAVRDTNSDYHMESMRFEVSSRRLYFKSTVSYVSDRLCSLFDTNTGQQGQHCSPYGSRALADKIVDGILDFSSYKNARNVGYMAGQVELSRIETTSFLLSDEHNQNVCNIEIAEGGELLYEINGDDFSYKRGFSYDEVLYLKAESIGEVMSMKTKTPFKSGFIELIVANPTEPLTSGYSPLAPVTLIIENNGIEVYNKIMDTIFYEKITLDRSDWGEVNIIFSSTTTEKSAVLVKDMMFFENDKESLYYPIDENSIVAYTGDSWGNYPGYPNVLIEPGDDLTGWIKASDGSEVINSGAYLPKRIVEYTGCTLDNWAIGGETSVYGYSKMWDILNRRRYTHLIIEFFTNDLGGVNIGMRQWEAYMRMLTDMCTNAGIQPIMISPVGTASVNQSSIHGQAANLLRKGLNNKM